MTRGELLAPVGPPGCGENGANREVRAETIRQMTSQTPKGARPDTPQLTRGGPSLRPGTAAYLYSIQGPPDRPRASQRPTLPRGHDRPCPVRVPYGRLWRLAMWSPLRG